LTTFTATPLPACYVSIKRSLSPCPFCMKPLLTASVSQRKHRCQRTHPRQSHEPDPDPASQSPSQKSRWPATRNISGR
jgi:hypothetical protein